MAIKMHVETVDNSKQYLAEMNNALESAVADLGNDLQGVAKQAAPEKTGNLVRNITVKFSNMSGAYQADLESTAVDGKHDYVDWMHNGRYNLGAKSKTKSPGQSRIGNFRKNVGRQYLIGSGEKASKGYREYVSKKVDSVNSRYNS